ncbi:MAG: hypothetical protein ACI825_001378 [Planctomycetota bacterium]|jgi:hypothetical protein|uniref:hypothetical protein n=1 Tax=Patiriisocius sp. Uisw_047 TaxID=3230969 RepID=UPI0039E95471
MKNIITSAIFLLLLFPVVYAQTQQPPSEKFDQYIAEVFIGDGVSQMSPETLKYTYVKKMYDNRIHFDSYSAVNIVAKGYENLSSVPLNTTYNGALQRDAVFDVATFNPLKYNFDYHARAAQVFVFDGTTTVMIIYPQSISQ